jgi:hypothetical protein
MALARFVSEQDKKKNERTFFNDQKGFRKRPVGNPDSKLFLHSLASQKKCACKTLRKNASKKNENFEHFFSKQCSDFF